jgi:hypothetical protein
LFQRRRQEETPATKHPQTVPLRWTPWSPKSQFQPIDLQSLADSDAGQKAWTDLESRLAEFWSKSRLAEDQWKRTGEKLLLWQGTGIEIAGAGFKIPVVKDFVRPLVLTPRFPEWEIPVGMAGVQLHFLGQVTLPTGFPVTGLAAQVAASYRIHYAGGKVQEIPLRQGFELAQANLVYEATRINPLPTTAQRVLEFVKDRAREHYQVLLFSVPTSGGKVDSITCRLFGDQPLLIFAITAELG